MDKFQLVTLSGVISDPRAGLNYIMSCFFFSKHSQSDLYAGSIISLPNIIKRSGNDNTEISNAIDKSLENLLGRYFPVVILEVYANDDDGPDIEVTIRGQVAAMDSTGEVRIDIGYTLSARDGKFRKIINELNNETIYS